MATDLRIAPLARHFVPKPLRRVVKQTYTRHKLDRVPARLTRLPATEVPSRDLLEDLQDAWDNRDMAARTDYLQAVAQAAIETTGPILECGSGLTTLLMAASAGRRGVESWTLEHLPEWRDQVAATIARNELSGTRLCLAPLREFDGYSWYDAPLDEMPPEFRLVVCDGPPGQTKGGRYGLVPMIGARLASDATILLDDAERPGEREVLDRWRDEAGLQASVHDTPTGTFAIVARPSAFAGTPVPRD